MAITPQEAAQAILRRQAARDRLLPFVEYTHPCWGSGAHHRRICEAMEKFESGEIRRLMIFAPPRCSKSEIASRRFPAWYLGRHPDHQVISASYGDELAHDIGQDVRDILRDPYYQHIFPGVELRADSQAAGRWRTTGGGIYVAAGVGGPIVGRGAHRAIIDDPIKGREQADSLRMREIAWRWYWGNLHTRLMPGGGILLMMTRWHVDDLAGRLLKTEGELWTVLEMPAISKEDTEQPEALWPEWFPLSEMRQLRGQMTKAGRMREWYAQYMQRPTVDQGTYFRREWFAERWKHGDATRVA